MDRVVLFGASESKTIGIVVDDVSQVSQRLGLAGCGGMRTGCDVPESRSLRHDHVASKLNHPLGCVPFPERERGRPRVQALKPPGAGDSCGYGPLPVQSSFCAVISPLRPEAAF